MDEEINNKQFFKEIIQNHYNDSTLQIIDFEVNSGIGKGENYFSVILRALIHWQRNNLERGEEHLVIKTMSKEMSALKMTTKGKLFDIENMYYCEIVPMYKSILNIRGIHITSRLAPTYLKCKNPNVVILEDLTPLGFRLGDRRNGGDFNHGLLLVKALARNQALSIAIDRKIPGYFEDKVSKVFLNEDFLSKPLKEHVELLEQWPEFQEYVGRIQAKSHEEILEILNAGKLKSICQGDCWMNNMLFRYDETTGAPIEVCLLDFQYYFWGSLVFDVIYFMYTSLSPHVLEHKKHILIDEYIDEFHKWMSDLGEELGEFTRENILKDFKKLQYLGVILVMTVLYINTCEPKDALNFGNYIADEGIIQRNKLRNDPFYKKKLLKHLKLFAKENII